jgi:Helix-turn-helix domain
MSNDYLPLVGLARYAGLSVRTLRGYLTHPSRPLPHYRIGGKILVRRSDFDAWAAGFRAVAPDRVSALVADALEGLG